MWEGKVNMWIKRFIDNVNEGIEKEEKIIINRRTFFFMSAGLLLVPKPGPDLLLTPEPGPPKLMKLISCSFHSEEVDDSAVFIRTLLDRKKRVPLSMDAAIEEIQNAIRLDLTYEDLPLYVAKFSQLDK